MQELQRVTTEYIDTEDRMRLTGAVGETETVVLWLTQRLLTRLLPHLFLWLEQQNGNNLPVEIVQSFAQQAARSELEGQPPVQSSADTTAWLVQAVDITPDNASLRMKFRGFAEEHATLVLPAKQLRQWLGIVHLLWKKGEWPKPVWPEWMGSGDTELPVRTSVAIH